MPRGRPRQFDREKALQDALLVFWRNGYHATSIPDLCEGMGILVTSLYAAFGSKEKLFVEAVELYMHASQQLLWAHLDKGLAIEEGVRDLLLATSKVMTDKESHPVGCWVTMALIDEDMPVQVASAIRKARSDWLDVLHRHLEGAVENGELSDTADLATLSRFLVGVVQAIGVQAHDGASQQELDQLVNLAMSALPPKGAAA